MSDLISRQAAIELLSQYPFEDVVNCISILEEMPSAEPDPLKIDLSGYSKEDWERFRKEWANVPIMAQPEPKHGKWLECDVFDEHNITEWQSAKCSVCGHYHTTPYLYNFTRYSFCPHCGSKMER